MQFQSTDANRRRAAFVQIDTRLLDTEARAVSAAVSSTTPVDRGTFVEVLDHSARAIDLGRASKGLSLIFGHDQAKPIGLADQFATDGTTLRCRLTFGRSQAAEEAWKDVQAGTLRHLSIGYVVHDTKKDANGTVRVTLWEPYEVSLVTVPADPNVGIGRSFTKGNTTMEVHQTNSGDLTAERSRVEAILSLGKRHSLINEAESAIRSGVTVEVFRSAVLDKISTRHSPIGGNVSWADDTARDRATVKQFSLSRAIAAQLNNDWSEAGLEREVSQEIARRSGRSASGFWVPAAALSTRATMVTTGSNVVGADFRDDAFVLPLANRAQVVNLGATVLPELAQNVAIPRQTGRVAAAWYAEDATITESSATFDNITMSPKQVSATSRYSKKLMVQGLPAIELLLRNDLQGQLGLAIDQAAISGLGSSNQPLGILATAGIGSVAGGANGLAPAWSHIVALETALANANADMGALGYLTNSKVRAKLKQVEKSATTGLFLWENGPGDGFDRVNGYRAAVSNQVPSNLTKGTSTGVCSAIIFGNWSDLIIGTWGQVDVLVDPYSDSAKANVRIVATGFVDIAVRHPESFAAMQDALTT